MKTINLFDRELKFSNAELYKCVELAIEMGLKVHTFKPSGDTINQIFVDNGITFGSISGFYSGVQYSTCHKSKRGSNCGTGFGVSGYSLDIETATKKGVESCFMFVPNWVCYRDGINIEKETFEQHISTPIGKILKYSEIKL